MNSLKLRRLIVPVLFALLATIGVAEAGGPGAIRTIVIQVLLELGLISGSGVPIPPANGGGVDQMNLGSLTLASGEVISLNGVIIKPGSGSPEGVFAAPVGSVYLRTNGGTDTTLYVKETGAGTTGWVPNAAGGGGGGGTIEDAIDAGNSIPQGKQILAEAENQTAPAFAMNDNPTTGVYFPKLSGRAGNVPDAYGHIALGIDGESTPTVRVNQGDVIVSGNLTVTGSVSGSISPAAVQSIVPNIDWDMGDVEGWGFANGDAIGFLACKGFIYNGGVDGGAFNIRVTGAGPGPLFRTSVDGTGYPGADFTGATTRFFQNASPEAAGLNYASKGEVWIVERISSFADVPYCFFFAGATPHSFHLTVQSGGFLQYLLTNNGTTYAVLSNEALTTGTHIIRFQGGGATWRAWIDGTELTWTVTSSSNAGVWMFHGPSTFDWATSSGHVFQVGVAGTTFYPFKGWMHEMMIFTGKHLTGAEATALLGHLQTKWGLTP